MAYRVNGVSVATVATDAHAVASIWNPHTTQRIKITELSLVAIAAPGAGAGVELRRITTRGTPGSTVTPTITSDDSRMLAPPSGALLDLAVFTAQPALDGAVSDWGWVLGGVIGAGFIYPFANGLIVPPGAGIAIVNRAAIVTPACEVSFVWKEHDD